MVDKLIGSIKKMGLTENEAKAYVGLVALNDANARELHEFTGIPRAKVYEILNNLVNMGYASVRQGSPIHYQPVEPKEFVRKNRENFLKEFEIIETGLKSLDYEKENESPIWYLKSKWTIDKKTREIIESSKESITIVCREENILFNYVEDLKKVKENVNILILVEDETKYKDIGIPVYKNKFIDFKDLLNYDNDNELKKSDLKKIENGNGIMLLSDKKTAILIQERANILESIIITMPFIEYIDYMIHFLHKYLNRVDVTTDSITFKFNADKKENETE